MINKKFLQTVAALMILIFHLWIPVTGTWVEDFCIKTGYVGVDIFFFLAAYSLADKEIDYGALIRNRIGTIYLKFILFALIALICGRITGIKAIKAIFMVDLFQKGGGAFLWFVPAIFLFYLIYPFFVKWKSKVKIFIVFIVWFSISYLIASLLGYTQILIFTNRIPVILIGYICKNKKVSTRIAVLSIVVGTILIYLLGYRFKLNVPIKEMFYIAAIVFVVGMAGISVQIKPSIVWEILGTATLECYALQMLFGPKLVMSLYRNLQSPILCNLLSITIMFASATILAKAYSYVYAAVVRILKKER